MRRPLLGRTEILVLAFSILASAMNGVHAQPAPAYPTKAVRLLVGNAPGGASDILARVLAQKLSEQWKGKSVVVENHAGALGQLAVDMTVRAAPDGYTLLIPAATTLVVPMLQKKIPYDVRTALAPITELTTQMLVFLATRSLPVNSVQELVTYAKGNPGTLNLGTSGAGSSGHAALALINQGAGLDIQHVPFKGAAPSLQALVAGQIQLGISSSIAGMPQARSGKAKALAVTGARRLQAFPDIPTLAESGFPGFEMTAWYGLYAPAGTPADVITLLHRDVTKILGNPELQSKLDGAEATPSASPIDLKNRLANEVTRWESLLKMPEFAASMQ